VPERASVERVENGAAECGVLDEEKDHPGRMHAAFIHIHVCVCVRGSYRVTHCVQLGKGKAGMTWRPYSTLFSNCWMPNGNGGCSAH
jgi:hypothetical protein